MQPNWTIAFSNVTTTEYAGLSYREYYSSPARMLEAQLAARDFIERRWGVGRFMGLGVDIPSCAFSSMLGMRIVEPSDEDEMPYLDTSQPLIRDVSEVAQLQRADPLTAGWMGKRYEFWRYYREQGHPVGFGGAGGAVVSAAVEITGNSLLAGMVEDPANARRVLEFVVEANERVARVGAELAGAEYQGFTYTGDDFSGLLSPAMYREFALPCYERLYAGNTVRFMHSELLRAEHLRIAREELGITSFHGAGCKNLTLAEMYEIMGEAFWTQVTPQEMAELTPQGLEAKVREYAECGCGWLQLYPGRGVPEANMEAAIGACERYCGGG